MRVGCSQVESNLEGCGGRTRVSKVDQVSGWISGSIRETSEPRQGPSLDVRVRVEVWA